MVNYSRGGVAQLRVTFLNHPDGVPVDPVSVTLRVLSEDTPVTGPHTWPGGAVERDLPGLFHYDWAIPADLPLGDYTAEWKGTISGSLRTGYELLTVVDGPVVDPGQPAAWASVQDVKTATGVDVDAVTVTRAQYAIDVACGRTFADAPRVSPRDRGWLRLATAYQAAWLTAQPDMWERMDLVETGGSAAAMSGTATWLTVAPMARRALQRVSWLRSRSLRVRSAFQDDIPVVVGGALAESGDDDQVWSPMGGR